MFLPFVLGFEVLAFIAIVIMVMRHIVSAESQQATTLWKFDAAFSDVVSLLLLFGMGYLVYQFMGTEKVLLVTPAPPQILTPFGGSY